MPFRPIRLGKEMIAMAGAALAIFFCPVIEAQTNPTVKLTVQKSAGGTITSTPDRSLTCTDTTCTGSYDKGTLVTLTVTPDEGFKLSGWNAGDCSTSTVGQSTSTCQFTLSADKTIRVNFVPTARLTVAAAPGGTVTSADGNIDCGSACVFDFDTNTEVTLTAKPDAGLKVRWGSGCTTTNDNICKVRMDREKTITVEFAGPTALIKMEGEGTVLIRSDSGGTVSCTQPKGNQSSGELWCQDINDFLEWFRQGRTVTLTAIPDPGLTFQGWGGGQCDGLESVCTIKLNPRNSIVITAIFADQETYPLYVNNTGSGHGVVTSIPIGINCGTNCQATYKAGTIVTLTAEISAGSHFSWGGACSDSNTKINGNKSICTLTMDQAQSVTAAFTSVPSITIHTTGEGHVSSSPTGILCGTTCSAEFEHGQTITLTALPATGYRFTGWGDVGACAGSGPDYCIVAVNSSQSVNAVFVQDVCEARHFSPTEERMMDMFIAYYGRAPYADGLRYWVNRLDEVGGNIGAIVSAFGNEPEYHRRSNGMAGVALVGRLYEYILGRQAEPEGLNWYTNELNTGRENVGTIAIKILDGTQGSDRNVLENRKRVARHLAFKTEPGRGTSNLTDVQLAEIMNKVTDNHVTSNEACIVLNNAIR